jgi:AcrR family transcriptional regulator
VAPVEQRRRGKRLEDAIVEATWEELRDHGYRGATVSGIAKRAGTSKPVLYRRWRSQPELVLAALRKFAATAEPPDTGDVREDLVAFLTRVIAVVELLPRDVVRGLLADTSGDATLFAEVRALVLGSPVHEMTRMILRRGAERGQCRPGPLPERVLRLPIDLLRSEYLLATGPLDTRLAAEIVDDVIMPLVSVDV